MRDIRLTIRKWGRSAIYDLGPSVLGCAIDGLRSWVLPHGDEGDGCGTSSAQEDGTCTTCCLDRRLYDRGLVPYCERRAHGDVPPVCLAGRCCPDLKLLTEVFCRIASDVPTAMSRRYVWRDDIAPTKNGLVEVLRRERCARGEVKKSPARRGVGPEQADHYLLGINTTCSFMLEVRLSGLNSIGVRYLG
jgi:hypothetical protein